MIVDLLRKTEPSFEITENDNPVYFFGNPVSYIWSSSGEVLANGKILDNLWTSPFIDGNDEAKS